MYSVLSRGTCDGQPPVSRTHCVPVPFCSSPSVYQPVPPCPCLKKCYQSRFVPVPFCISPSVYQPVPPCPCLFFCTSPVPYQSRSVSVPVCTSQFRHVPVHFLYQSRSVPVCTSHSCHVTVMSTFCTRPVLYQSRCVPASSVISLSTLCTSLTVYQPVPSYPCPSSVPV